MNNKDRMGWAVGLLVVLAAGCEFERKDADEKGFPSEPPPSNPGIFQPTFSGAAVTADRPPPPISGGTLLILRDGKTSIAADPDLDKIFAADLQTLRLTATVALEPGAEPGRSVEDGAGRVHVILRGRGSVLTLTAGTFAAAAERPVCAAPRGIAFAAATDQLLVACAGGELVALPPEGPVLRTVLVREGNQTLDDLRDVAAVDDGMVVVSRFRSAQMVLVSPETGLASKRWTAPGSVVANTPIKSVTADGNASLGVTAASPSVAWRMRALPGGGVAMIHQEAANTDLGVGAGGYGQGQCSGPIVAAVTTYTPGKIPQTSGQLLLAVLPVDFALSSNGLVFGAVAAGNKSDGRSPVPSVFVQHLAALKSAGCVFPGRDVGLLPDAGVFRPDAAVHGVFPGGNPDAGVAVAVDAGAPEADAAETPLIAIDSDGAREPVGTPIAIAFDGLGRAVVQTRNPARLEIVTGGTGNVALSEDIVEDTGHLVFHAAVGAGLACASCHPEGGDDGRVWNFTGIGPRRTQNLRGGIGGTAPFHWDGDMHDMNQLMNEVFSQRMGGPSLSDGHKKALAGWVDRVPALVRGKSANPDAVARGKALFESGKQGCAVCHNGARFSNNASYDVGTGRAFQTPSLLGVGSRAPFMHNGCAQTLRDRFTETVCGGGDKHGATSHLALPQLDDLVMYLESL